MISTILLGLVAVCLAFQLATVGLSLWHMRRRADSRTITGTPRITLMRPVTGSDPLDALTLATSFRQDWPNYEVVFCAPRDSDPVVPVVQRLIAENPQVPARLLIGQERITGNPKLDNLWKGWEATESDWVCMADSNLSLPPDYLTTLVRSWRPKTGLVSAPACGQEPVGFAGQLECAFLNSNQGKLQLAAAALNFGFAQGKTLFWNRPLLNSWGGLMPLGKWLAEDVTATKLVRGAGKTVTLPPRLFAQPIGRRSFRQVWDRQLRWSRVRRDGFPLPFVAEIANGVLPPLVLLALSPLWAWQAPFVVLWFGVEWWLCRRAGWPSGPMDVAAMVLRDLMLPAIWVATYFGRGISWRGNDMAPPNATAGKGAA